MTTFPAQERLHASRRDRELAAIVESSADAIIGKTLDGTITSWNAAAERIYGYTAAEAIGRSIETLEPEDRRGEIKRLLEELRAGRRIEPHRTVRRRKDGSRVDVLLTISPIRNDEGEVVGASTIAGDIRELLTAREALRRSEESYRRLFEGHPQPMWVFDPETFRFLAVNEAAVASYGYSREEFLAMTADEIRPAEDVARAREAVARAGLDYAGKSYWRHCKKNGTLIDVAVTSSMIEFEGRPARLVHAEDVTDQRRLEEQLRQSQKMEAIGRLAGGIAHDFNNLLLVIRGYSAMLLKRLDGKNLECVEQIDGAAARAGDFTRQLLAFSRQQVLQLAVTDVNSVVAETLRLLRRSLGEHVEVKTRLDPEIAPVLVDRSQLTQAVLNLAINARDAMPGGGTIVIRTANAELGEAFTLGGEDVVPGTYVLLQITDSGIGMDEETKGRAFDPFYTTKADGTGLGLATVYGLVRQSGGHIWLYSEEGIGTTFKLYFPATGEVGGMTAAQQEVESLQGHETVLVVEDAEMVRTLVTTTLESYGYDVLEASGAAEAIELARQRGGAIDLLLTDVVMPGANGRELADTLVAAYPGLRVLYTSGYPADTVVRHGIAEARAAFIEKPYLPDDLARKVREVLDGGSR